MCFPNEFQLFSFARDVRCFLCHSQTEDLPITIEQLNNFLVEQCCGIAMKRPDKMFDLVRCMGEYAGDLARILMQFFCRDNNVDKAAFFEPKHATPCLMQDGISTHVSWKSFIDCFYRDRMCTMKTCDTMTWLLRFLFCVSNISFVLTATFSNSSYFSRNMQDRVECCCTSAGLY